jgi:hypothetical protein
MADDGASIPRRRRGIGPCPPANRFDGLGQVLFRRGPLPEVYIVEGSHIAQDPVPIHDEEMRGRHRSVEVRHLLILIQQNQGHAAFFRSRSDIGPRLIGVRGDGPAANTLTPSFDEFVQRFIGAT